MVVAFRDVLTLSDLPDFDNLRRLPVESPGRSSRERPRSIIICHPNVSRSLHKIEVSE
jgi:hypothetical protein